MKIIGDIHGDTSYLKRYLEKYNDEEFIIVGDVGLGFNTAIDQYKFPERVKFIRGNHDNPKVCQEHPNYLGDYGSLNDGQIFFVGGAFSIDKQWRTPHVDWWPDEEINESEHSAILEQYYEAKPQFVISHDAPFFCTSILKQVATLNKPYLTQFGEPKRTKTSDLLERMWKIHKPEYWYHGHWHCSCQFQYDMTRFICLDINEIIAI